LLVAGTSLDAARFPRGRLDITGPDLAYRRLAIVNVAFRGPPDAGDRGWGR
jgi:hypothetical protein